jgi:hypothetical protein
MTVFESRRIAATGHPAVPVTASAFRDLEKSSNEMELRLRRAVLQRMTKTVIHNMRSRIEQLREVARTSRDPSVTTIALKMADDIEADVRELEANAAGKSE